MMDNIIKKTPIIEKIEAFKDIASGGLKNSTDLDKEIVERKISYRDSVSKSNEKMIELLEKNMELATSEQERQEIRDQMHRIKMLEQDEMKDYDTFANNIQERHNLNTLRNLIIVGGAYGLFKLRKPVLNIGK